LTAIYIRIDVIFRAFAITSTIHVHSALVLALASEVIGDFGIFSTGRAAVVLGIFLEIPVGA